MAGDDGRESAGTAAGLSKRVEKQWLEIKEHAETYPYVWGSYILVYGGLGAYMAYGWRKLRRTEDRVRILQRRLRVFVEAEESASASGAQSKIQGSWWSRSVLDPFWRSRVTGQLLWEKRSIFSGNSVGKIVFCSLILNAMNTMNLSSYNSFQLWKSKIILFRNDSPYIVLHDAQDENALLTTFPVNPSTWYVHSSRQTSPLKVFVLPA